MPETERLCPACASGRTEILCIDCDIVPRDKDDRNVPLNYMDFFQCEKCGLVWCVPHVDDTSY